MKHAQYHDHQVITHKFEKTTATIRIYAVGSQPSKVAAEYIIPGTQVKGIAYGGFQSSKDFDFQTAASLAIENAISRMEASV